MSPAPGIQKVIDRWQTIRNWFLFRGFDVKMAFPDGKKDGFVITDDEYSERIESGWELFYRPATDIVPYDALMFILGQEFHWTINKGAQRFVAWYNIKNGYWFWYQVGDQNLHLGEGSHREYVEKCGSKFVVTVKRIPLLEEYVIVWHLHKAVTGQEMDLKNWIWSATLFKKRNLDLKGESGYGINVGSMNAAACFENPPSDCGLRLVEVIS